MQLRQNSLQWLFRHVPALVLVSGMEMEPATITKGSFTLSRTAGIRAIAAGSLSTVVLKGDGTVVAWGRNYYGQTTVAAVNNGDRTGAKWGSGGGWNDATNTVYPDAVQITFNGQKSISEIDLFTLQDNYSAPAAPTAAMTFTKYGITAFDVQYCPAGATCSLTGTTGWVTVPGGSITGNNLVWRTVTLATPVTTDRIRVQVNASLAGYSRIVEIEAYP